MEDREEFIMEVQQNYDEYLMKTENRGISYGEIAYIQGLSDKELKDLNDEAIKELEKE
jgi:hypothetical protein